MKITKELKERAIEFGRAAFHNGIKCAPVNDKAFMATLNLKVAMTIENMKFHTELYKAWQAGWIIEELNTPVLI